EVGYGPGYSIDFILDHYSNVRIDGIDVSETMKDQAAHRLGSEIKAGKVHLSADAVEEAVFLPNHYHRIFTVNNFTLWQEKIVGLQKLYEALVRGGRIAITMQPRQEDAKSNQTRIFAEEIRKDLAECGYKRIKVRFKRVSPEWAVCVTAIKP
ncbi:MAG TPA: class I SAM-dependent methyltransferase, partial [Bacillales bacterium]